MLPTTVAIEEATTAVSDFNRVFGQMERATWCLSRASRDALLGAAGNEVVTEMVWVIKTRMGVQFVSKEMKSVIVQALRTMSWTPELFDANKEFSLSSRAFAHAQVSKLVNLMIELGAKRQEFSWSSKVLHWLLPWRVPVYDKFVRDMVGLPASWPHDKAYARIVEWEFDAASQLLKEGTDWIGDVEPFSPLRALDKYLWWRGGGQAGRSMVVNDPWRVVDRLGIPRA